MSMLRTFPARLHLTFSHFGATILSEYFLKLLSDDDRRRDAYGKGSGAGRPVPCPLFLVQRGKARGKRGRKVDELRHGLGKVSR